MEENNEEKKVKKKNNKEVEKLEQEITSLQDKYLRSSAEIQNMKRRFEEELAKYFKYEGEDFIKNILLIVDDFERAINMDDNDLNDAESRFLVGFKMIYARFIDLLKDREVIEIDCLGKEFDPNTMEAILTDKDETRESNIVLDVLQKGYIYKDKVIRPAMVKVNE